MADSPLRGELWWVDWSPGRGSEQAGRRPALVVQADAANRQQAYPNTIVVAVSTRGRELPFHVRLEPDAGNGLAATSYAKCEQLLTIAKSRLRGRIGRIPQDRLAEVDEGLRLVLGL